MVKLIHIAAVELFAAIVLVQTARLWFSKKPVLPYSLPVKIILASLFVCGISAGLYMYAVYYQFYTPYWLELKLVLVGLAFISGLAGTLRHQRSLLLVSTLLNVLIIIIANLKPM